MLKVFYSFKLICNYMDNKELFRQAKEAYYNGNPIMSDLEFDQLEKELGLENKSYIGSVNNPSYTVQHPVLMGSLSKIQIKENKDHTIDFGQYLSDLRKYMDKSSADVYEISPKYDGASIELVFDRFGILLSASTRGDGNKGKDIKVWYENEYKKYNKAIKNICMSNLSEGERLVVRGECLVKIDTFLSKYKSEFVNPRAWVAGCIGQKWENTDLQNDYRNDLDFVFYTFIKITSRNKAYELDIRDMYDGLSTIGNYATDREYINRSYLYNDPKIFENIYKTFENVRKTNQYALDGFVIKPVAAYRLNDFTRERPEDSVAIKFVPEILQSKITDIIWKLGKNNEWYPTAVLEPVYIDGKKIMKASLHNYNYIISHNSYIGSIVRISLAGDIIPFVYEIVESNGDNCNLPENFKIYEETSGVIHLMIGEIDKTAEAKNRFINSAETLNLTNLGPKTAAKLWDIMYNNRVSEMESPMFNICQLFDEYSKSTILKVLGDSKSTSNILEVLEKAPYVLMLEQIIDSCNFPACGTRASKRIAEMIWRSNHEDYIITENDFPGLNREAWSWVLDKSSDQWKTLMNLAVFFTGKGKNIYDRVDLNNKIGDNSIIKIIMTGGPEGMTKKEWISKHPEYEETTKWTECQILFCNDLSSTSSKMKKAQKLGIKIKLYD